VSFEASAPMNNQCTDEHRLHALLIHVADTIRLHHEKPVDMALILYLTRQYYQRGLSLANIILEKMSHNFGRVANHIEYGISEKRLILP